MFFKRIFITNGNLNEKQKASTAEHPKYARPMVDETGKLLTQKVRAWIMIKKLINNSI